MVVSKNSSAKKSTLKIQYEEKLRSSKLNPTLVKSKLKFVLHDKKSFPTELPHTSKGQDLRAAGFSIPYYSLKKRPTGYFRFRYLQQPERKGFAAVAQHKELRYVQPASTAPQAYFPPLVDWYKVSVKNEQPIIITEGELKAACTTEHTDFPTIGLGGVWSWRSAKLNQALIPDLEQFDWSARTVYIVFDSDAATNPQVAQAQLSLAARLTAAGATPYICRLPPADDGGKQGLDDFLLVHTAGELTQILERAEPFSAAAELHALNAEVVYVMDPGLVLRHSNLQRMKPSAFREHHYANRTYTITQVRSDGSTKLVEKSAPTEWLKWRGRAEVARTTYAPGAPRLHRGELNVWPGWAVAPAAGDVQLWSQLLDVLFAGEPESRKWFESWLAWPLQNPGDKIYSCPVLWSRRHGTGKSFVGYAMKQIYGGNWAELDEAVLRQAHNGWAENKQFIMADEITSGDKRATGDLLKSIITRETVHVNQKYIPEYDVPDRINWYFTSNHPDALFLEDDDRRFFVHEVTADPAPMAFYTQLEHWLRRDLYPDARGPAALFAHLLSLDLSDFNPRARAPTTRAKEEMLDLGRGDLGSWVSQLKRSPDNVLRLGGAIVPHVLYTAEDLLQLYDPDHTKRRVSANGISRELKRQGFAKAGNWQVCPAAGGQHMLWVCREPPFKADDILRSPAEAGKWYDRERTAQQPKVARARKTK